MNQIAREKSRCAPPPLQIYHFFPHDGTTVRSGKDPLKNPAAQNPRSMALTNNDKHNIINAFETDDPEKFFAIWKNEPKGMLIPEAFDYYSQKADLSKYIEEYNKITDKNEQNRFWLKYKR